MGNAGKRVDNFLRCMGAVKKEGRNTLLLELRKLGAVARRPADEICLTGDNPGEGACRIAGTKEKNVHC